MAHQADADVMGEAVAEEAFGEAGGAHEEIAEDGEGKFGDNERPKVIRNAGFCGRGGGYAVNDEFGDPEHAKRDEGP